MNRREFLQGLAAAPLLALPVISSRVWASAEISSNDQKLLLIFLRGAYDGLNLLVPHNDSFYYESRPSIGLKKSDDPTQSLLALNADFSLHPVVKDTLLPLFQNHELSFVHAAGSPDNSRSHFHAQDVMEFGVFNDAAVYPNGFLYRFYQSLHGVNRPVFPLSYTSNLPLIFKGDSVVPNISLKGNLKFNLNDSQVSLYDRLYSHSALAAVEQQGIQIHKQAAVEYEQEMKEASRGAASAKGFAEETARMARFIKEQQGISIGFIDVGGWDTHVNQGSYNGQYANNLKQLAEGIANFRQAMGSQWKQTTVAVISEFGRTVRENGDGGTDHGHGNVMWLLGGDINGGKVLGEWNGLGAATLHENRDLPVLNDYRSVLAEIFASRFQLSEQQNRQIFPGYVKQSFNV